MVANYSTKSLQGAAFQKLQNLIMNIGPAAAHHWDHRSVLKVENGTRDSLHKESIEAVIGVICGA